MFGNGRRKHTGTSAAAAGVSFARASFENTALSVDAITVASILAILGIVCLQVLAVSVIPGAILVLVSVLGLVLAVQGAELNRRGRRL